MGVACPRLRPLEMFPIVEDGERLLCLRDPAGLSEEIALLPPAAVVIVAACDGKRDATQVAAAAARRLDAPVCAADVAALLERLDAALLLDTPRFRAHAARLAAEFRATPTRTATHAGGSYLAAPAALAAFLDAQLATARARPAERRAPASPPRALVAPHIDFHRGGPIYGDAYLPLAAHAAASSAAYDLVVVFGTDHNGVDEPFSLTRKSYATPLGDCATDVELVDALAAELGDQLFAEELHHRREHSIEFQAVWLRHLFGARVPPLLPVLCGPFADPGGDGTTIRDAVPRFLTTLARRIEGRRALFIAGADLAHVGPRFGDAHQGAAERALVEHADRAALAHVLGGRAQEFFDVIVRDDDRFRVCGTSPIVATLSAATASASPVHAELAAYAQCPADDEHASFVSIAAAALW